MSDLRRIEPEGGANIVLNDGTSVDMKTLQGIYNEITGRSEKLGKLFKDAHVIKFADIEQLLLKMHQSIQQYGVKGANCNVTVFFTNANRAVFSSFEKFRQFDTSSTTPTEAIDIDFNFMIVLPDTQHVQSYKINITIFSRAALRSKAADAHGIEGQLLELTSAVTGKVDIEYVDYSVARFLLTTIEDWYSGVSKTRSSLFADIARKTSRWHGDVFRIIGMAILSAYVFFNANSIFLGVTTNIAILNCFVCVSLLIVIAHISYILGDNFEDTVDLLNPVSALVFNKGDENTVAAYNAGNTKIIAGAIALVSAQVAISVLANLIASWLGSSPMPPK